MEYWIGYVDQALVFVVLAVSLNLLVGYAGIFSIGSGALSAVGGYTSALVSLWLGVPPALSLVAALVAGAVVGLIIAEAVLRLAEEHVMLMTMSLSILVASIVAAIPEFGGQHGLYGLPPLDLGWGDIYTPSGFFIVLLIAAILIVAICWRLGESSFGRLLRASQNNDLGVQSLGKSPRAARLFVFSAMSSLTALGGALLVIYNGIAAPSMFSLDQTMLIFAMVIIGGIASVPGSIIGAFLITMTTPVLEKLLNFDAQVAALSRPIVFGLLLVIVMRLRPTGLVPEWHPLPRRSGDTAGDPVVLARTGDTPDADMPLRSGQGPHDVVLEVRDLHKAFGGIAAVQGLSLELHRGEITALIGPNGAGKSTVFNLITGAIPIDHGSVWLNAREITGQSPQRIARAGMVRSFQDLRVFPQLTPLENVMLARRGVVGENPWKLFVPGIGTRRAERAAVDAGSRWLEFAGLDPSERAATGSLSFAQQKLVVFARVLATDADIFLLDEPMSGIEGSAAEEMLLLIERMRGLGRTICVVEHSIKAVSRLADKAYFMETGRVTAEGTVGELLADRRLAEVYFGVS